MSIRSRASKYAKARSFSPGEEPARSPGSFRNWRLTVVGGRAKFGRASGTGERDRLRRIDNAAGDSPARNRRRAIETSKETGGGGGRGGGGERMSKKSQWRGSQRPKKGHRKLVDEERTKLGRFSIIRMSPRCTLSEERVSASSKIF